MNQFRTCSHCTEAALPGRDMCAGHADLVVGINEFPVQASAQLLQRDNRMMFVQHNAAASVYYVTMAQDNERYADVISVKPYHRLIPGTTLNEAQRRRIAYRAALEALARCASEDIYYEDTGGRTA